MPFTNSAAIIKSMHSKVVPPAMSAQGVNRKAISELLQKAEHSTNTFVEDEIKKLAEKIIHQRLQGVAKGELPTTLKLDLVMPIKSIADDRNSVRVLQAELEKRLEKAEYTSFEVSCPKEGGLRGAIHWSLTVDFQLP